MVPLRMRWNRSVSDRRCNVTLDFILCLIIYKILDGWLCPKCVKATLPEDLSAPAAIVSELQQVSSSEQPPASERQDQEQHVLSEINQIDAPSIEFPACITHDMSVEAQ